jgi:hypothetical protein
MAHSYTPGLTVTEQTVVRKRRLLPIPGTVLAKQGAVVASDTIVARTELAGKVHVLNLANQLGVAPDEIRDYLVKQEGETIQQQDVIAENKPLIKWLKTEIRSPIHGTVDGISTITGQVLLREPPRALDLTAYVDGTVVNVQEGRGVTVECEGSLVQGIFGIGGETWGNIVLAVASPSDQCAPERLTADMKGTIVVAGSFLGHDTMQRAKALGIAALVVGGLHDKDLRAILGYDLGVAITGTERVGFTLVVTEGFGVISMATRTFDLLAKHAGRKASISGATQIRAGVIRPEIIIARDTASGSRLGADRATADQERGGLRIGDQVRIIRDPLFGRIGRIAALPSALQAIETESRVRVLEVRFDDGTGAVIPRANVELIEGDA